jgi:pilus assembly protein CpaF
LTLLQKRLEQSSKNLDNGNILEANKESSVKNSQWHVIRDRILHDAVEELDTQAMDNMPENEKSLYVAKQIGSLLNRILNESEYNLTRVEYHRLVEEVGSEITGYGPITPLLNDNTVNEIMVNGPNQVYIERQGKLEVTDITFRDNNHVMNIIERIVAPLGKRIDESSPLVDARLPDGSRVNAIIPPIALDGPTLTIRKFSTTPYTMADLTNFGTMTTDMALFLDACVKGRLNIVIGGGTASGKTTTLNVLSACIPNHDRIVTIEDAAELQLQQDHVVRLEARPHNIEGKGRIAIRDLVINALRMRPDRIIVGEVRGGEALDMLQAMNTGHEGSLTTGHANSPRDLLARIESMVLMSEVELPLKAIREQMVSAINLIVYQGRLRDGTRKITKITEVVGMEGDVITLQDIFVFDQQGVGEKGRVLGSFRATGVPPKALPLLEAKGIRLPANIFS